ncbi:MAG: type II toxin-antitoxin system prevent-host-death family antitoxin [Treponema sp.]|jgi:prevent-host-death family protein|nr:type II toxin-antitoxin system prevent-host-death family antitoxin [Treponema sp.]
MNTKVNSVWQLQEAKAMFSQVIKSAARCPQIITVRGENAAVVLSMEAYRKMTKPKMTTCEFFRNSPLADVELETMFDQPVIFRDINL